MPIPLTVGAFAIVPSNDLPAAEFRSGSGWASARTGGDEAYIIADRLGLARFT